jgi:hypothetical protein
MGIVNGVLYPYFLFLQLSWASLNLSSLSAKRFTYNVHMEKSLMPKAFNSHQNWYSSTVDSLKFMNKPSLNGNPSPPSIIYIYEYDNSLHGFSATLSLDELEALQKSQGFHRSLLSVIVLPSSISHVPLNFYPSAPIQVY